MHIVGMLFIVSVRCFYFEFVYVYILPFSLPWVEHSLHLSYRLSLTPAVGKTIHCSGFPPENVLVKVVRGGGGGVLVAIVDGGGGGGGAGRDC